jgi:hypothetical protein
MVKLNKGKENEVAIRLVMESEEYGREYFDGSETLKELLESAGRLAANASKETARDGIERSVTIVAIPKANYDVPWGYGFGMVRDE